MSQLETWTHDSHSSMPRDQAGALAHTVSWRFFWQRKRCLFAGSTPNKKHLVVLFVGFCVLFLVERLKRYIFRRLSRFGKLEPGFLFVVPERVWPDSGDSRFVILQRFSCKLLVLSVKSLLFFSFPKGS